MECLERKNNEDTGYFAERPDVVIVAYSSMPYVAVFLDGVMASAGVEYIDFEGYANETPKLTLRFDADTFVRNPLNKKTFEEFYRDAAEKGLWKPAKKESECESDS